MLYFVIKKASKRCFQLLIRITTINKGISRENKEEDIEIKFDTISIVETEKVTLKGIVKDKYNNGISNAIISCNNTSTQSINIPEGSFSLQVDDNPNWKLRITIFHDIPSKKQTIDCIVKKEDRKQDIEIIFDLKKKKD